MGAFSLIVVINLLNRITMQDPNEDTEWNDVLRAKGIIPPKEPEITEDQIADMIDQVVQKHVNGDQKDMEDMNLDELDDIEDDITEADEKAFEEYRRKRMAELKAMSSKPRFGSVIEISGQDWVEAINKAGDDIWVIVHLYKNGIEMCNLLNHHFVTLAQKFPFTKFIKAVATTCIPNYPEHNLPTIFIYQNGEMKEKLIGRDSFPSGKVTQEDVEWQLSQTGAIETDLTENPRKPVEDVFSKKTIYQ